MKNAYSGTRPKVSPEQDLETLGGSLADIGGIGHAAGQGFKDQHVLQAGVEIGQLVDQGGELASGTEFEVEGFFDVAKTL